MTLLSFLVVGLKDGGKISMKKGIRMFKSPNRQTRLDRASQGKERRQVQRKRVDLCFHSQDCDQTISPKETLHWLIDIPILPPHPTHTNSDVTQTSSEAAFRAEGHYVYYVDPSSCTCHTLSSKDFESYFGPVPLARQIVAHPREIQLNPVCQYLGSPYIHCGLKVWVHQ